MANLMQVSSAFGRALEAVDRRGMCKRLYPHARAAQSTMDAGQLKAAIGAAEGMTEAEFASHLDAMAAKKRA